MVTAWFVERRTSPKNQCDPEHRVREQGGSWLKTETQRQPNGEGLDEL